MRNLILLTLLGLAFTTCDQITPNGLNRPADPYAEPSIENDALNVIVEIPAGTNHKIEFKPERGFANDTLAGGATRIVNFLPYPGNYGFVPSTLMDASKGGDGDPLDVLVLAESLPTGTKIATRPIAALLLRDRGEIDTKIIAVPVDSTLRVFDVENFLEFSLEHNAALRIIENWFLHYKGPKLMELQRWEDENYAWREVRKWKMD
ncbi:MAG: inorganic diphosphatase [Bacteroidota bacterium]